jgi:hypothetical protein
VAPPVESRSYAGWPSARHALRPPIGQLTSARRLAASCTPALVARTKTIQLHLLITSAYVPISGFSGAPTVWNFLFGAIATLRHCCRQNLLTVTQHTHRRCPRFAFCVFAGRAARKHWDVWPASRRESSAESGLLGFQEAPLPNQGHGRGFRRRQGGEYSHLTSCSSPPCCRDAQFVFCG